MTMILMTILMIILMMITNKVINTTYFFCPIDLVINRELAIWAELQNCPLDGIDVNCHCDRQGSSNVEEAVQLFSKYWNPVLARCLISSIGLGTQQVG